MQSKLKSFVAKIGVPRLIIMGFVLFLAIAANSFGMNMAMLASDSIRRWGMNGILVLAMVPAVQCGIGLNFGISLGIAGGLLGSVIAIEMDVSSWSMFAGMAPESVSWSVGWTTLIIALTIGTIISSLIGWLYGLILNKVKGSEMTVSTYVGFSMIALMNIVWLSLPFKQGQLIWPVGGQGLRNTIDLSDSFGKVLSNAGFFTVFGVEIPTGLMVFFFASCFAVWLFLRSKTGIAMSAGGSNPTFAKASGINVNKTRIIGTTLSTAIGAIGIIAYSQGYGFVQLYNAPMFMGFFCVASVLVGGASTKKATIGNVILGTFLFQTLLALGLPVANQFIPEGNLSEVMRLIISNGIILYALTKSGGGKSRE